MTATQPGASAADLFPGGGEMGERIRDLDWSATSLGPVDRWSPALRSAVRMTIDSPFPISLWCGPQLLLIYNDAYQCVLGTRHLRALGCPGHEVWSDAWHELGPMFEQIRSGGKPTFAEDARFVVERPDGPTGEAWFTFGLSPIRDDAGEIVAFLHIASETTKRVEAERRYHFLTNALPVQIWTATPDGALDYVSDRVAEYFGKTPAQVIGEGWLSVLHPDDVDRTIQRWSASLQSGQPYEVEFRLWSAEHSAYRWHLGRAMPQRDASGNIIRWFGTNTEIEERKQTEVELRRLTAEATEADRAKAAFLAAMSHELRTPLNAIGGYAQLIEMGVRGPITEDQRLDLLKIQRSKNHLDALVSDVLSFAKLGSGKVEYHLTDVDVQSAIQSVLEMVGPQIADKQLRIAPFSTPRQLLVVADGDKLRQILINLFGNALKFTPKGGTITLDVKAKVSDVSISVTDTGIGISEEDQDRIFEPFVQSGDALDSRDQGVGLGLAISRQLARAMRGELRVTSTLGVGSTFTLTLPRRS